MQVKAIASPHQLPPNSSSTDSKARAIEAFNRAATPQTQAQEYAVPNPNAVSAEDLGGIRAQQQQIDVPIEDDVPAQEEKKEDPALSRQFAQLARQERALRAKQQQQEQAWKAKEQELAAREAQLSKQTFDPNEYIPRSRLRDDAYSVLVEEGINLDDTYQQHINRAPIDPTLQSHINKLEAKLAKLEEQSQTSQKSYQEQQTQAYASAIKQITSDAKALVNNNPSEYESIAKTNSIKDVVDLIEATFKADGIVLSVEEAAQEVETYIADELYKHATNIDKIKKRMSNPGQGATSDEKSQANKQPQTMKTLTNANSSSRKLTAKERAVLAFKGELKP